MAAMQHAYTSFFGGAQRRSGKGKKQTVSGEAELPVVLVPQESGTECVASPHLSTFGFLGFVLNVVNAIINVANNINNDDNSNNNNDNNNNNNDLNTNQAQVTQTQTNTNMAMAVAGRRLERLRQMRQSVSRSLDRLRQHQQASRRRRSAGEPVSISSNSLITSCDGAGGLGPVDEAVVAAAALLELWGRLLTEAEPECLGLEVCRAAASLSAASRLSRLMAQVAVPAAAHTLLNIQGVNPEYLVTAGELGAAAGEAQCEVAFPACAAVAEASTAHKPT